MGHDAARPARGAAREDAPTATCCSPAASTTRGRPRWSPRPRPPRSERGVRVGALMGTAYLFTREATESGAITPLFQEAAIAAGDTALLESGPGHATRCLPSPFVEQFDAERRSLRGRGHRLRGAARPARAAEHRTPADRGEGRRPGIRELRGAGRGLVAVEPDRAVGAGHVHDRPGRGAARRGDDGRRPAPRYRRGSSELLATLAGARARPRAAAAAARGRRDRRARLHPPRRARRETSGRTSSTRSTRSARCPPSAGTGGGCSTPTRARATRSTRAGAGSSIPWRSTRSRSGCRRKSLDSIEPFQLLALLCAQAALEDAGYATRPFDRERTSVILGAGGGGADTVGRLHGPLGAAVAARRRPPRAPGAAVRAAARVDRGQLRRPADERRRGAHRQPPRLRRHQLHRRRGLRLLAQRDRPRRARAADGHERHGARGRRRRDPEPVRLPVLRQDARAVAPPGAAGRSTPPPTGSRSARGSRRSCSSASPTPSATATASTP